MENNSNENHGSMKMGAGLCNSAGGCGCGHHHMHIMKWLIKIAVLIIIFCFAFQMGELKGMLRSQDFGGYGHRGGIYAQPMMGGGYYYGTDGTVPDASTTPSAPTK